MAMTASDATTTLRSLVPRLDRAMARDKGFATSQIAAARTLIAARTAELCAQMPATAELVTESPARLATLVETLPDETWHHPMVGDAIEALINDVSTLLRQIDRTIDEHSSSDD
jgi:hypothetical protein